MAEESQKITVRPSEPYLVRGAIPLVRKSQVMSEHGEPLSWKDEGVIDAGETYRLCRCGQSKSKPFCDGAHTLVEFDGTEAADTGTVPTALLPGSPQKSSSKTNILSACTRDFAATG